MKWKNLIKVAFKSIVKNKMRTLLTMLGIIIGVGAVIVMVAIGKGAEQRIQNQISSMGTNLIMVYPGSSQQRGVHLGPDQGVRLTLDDVEWLKKNSTLLEAVSPVVRSGVQVIGGSGNWNSSVYGVSEGYLTIRDWKLSSGDFFTANDIRAQSKICIIGQTIVKNLFANEDPVGQQLRLRNVPFKVIGVLKERGQSAFGQDQDDVIIAPYSTVYYRLSGQAHIHQILARAASLNQMEQAQAEITAIMRESHKLAEGEDADFTVRNQTDIASTAQETTRVLTILLASIASISLLVGGIGIMNIMLVSVTERTHEIGIRMALGAREAAVVKLVVRQSALLTIVGLVLGTGGAVALARLLASKLFGVTPLDPTTYVVAALIWALLAMLASIVPARAAARVNPVEALRYD